MALVSANHETNSSKHRHRCQAFISVPKQLAKSQQADLLQLGHHLSISKLLGKLYLVISLMRDYSFHNFLTKQTRTPHTSINRKLRLGGELNPQISESRIQKSIQEGLGLCIVSGLGEGEERSVAAAYSGTLTLFLLVKKYTHSFIINVIAPAWNDMLEGRNEPFPLLQVMSSLGLLGLLLLVLRVLLVLLLHILSLLLLLCHCCNQFLCA